MDLQLIALSVLRTASAASAAVLALLAWRAYSRSGKRSLRRLAAGSALLVAGFVGAGALYQIRGNVADATIIEAPFTLAALVLMLVSLFGRDAAPVERKAPPAPHPTPR